MEERQKVVKLDRVNLVVRAGFFAIFSATTWCVLIFAFPMEADVRKLLGVTAAVGVMGQLACFIISAFCQKTGLLGMVEYLLSMPCRTGGFLIGVLISLVFCAEESQKIFAVRVAIGYFITFPVLLALTFPSEKRTRELILERSSRGKDNKISDGGNE